MKGEDVRNVTGLPIADLDAHGSHQNEAGQAVGTLDGHLGRDPSTERGADHHHVAQIARGQQVEVEIGEIVDRVDAVNVRRMTEAGMRRGKHLAVRGQQVQKGVVRPEALFAVKPEEWLAPPALDVLEGDVGN